MKINHPILFMLGIFYVLIGVLLLNYTHIGQATKIGSWSWIVIGVLLSILTIIFPKSGQ